MSAISSTHSVVGYTGKEKAFADQRLSKVTWKTDKETGVKKDSVCVSLPVITAQMVVDNIAALAPAVAEYLMTVQDKIVRERVEAGAAQITDAEISTAAICEYLVESDSNTGGRLTKESVGVWFDSALADSLAMALMEKMGVSEIPSDAESAQILKVVGTFKEKITALAGGKTSYPVSLAASLKKAIELAPADDALAAKFAARLDKMMQVQEVDLLAML
jgi:hypothetical protein